MNRTEYAAIARGHGAKVRQFFANAANRTMATRSLAQLRADLTDLDIPDDKHDEWIATYRDVYEQSRGMTPFVARQLADEVTVGVVRQLRAADDLLGDAGMDDPEAPPVAEITKQARPVTTGQQLDQDIDTKGETRFDQGGRPYVRLQP